MKDACHHLKQLQRKVIQSAKKVKPEELNHANVIASKGLKENFGSARKK